MYNLSSVLQAKQNNFKAVIDDDKDGPRSGVFKLVHKLSEVKMVRIEATDVLCEALVNDSEGMANMATIAQKPVLRESLEHRSLAVLKSTLLHVNGIKESGIETNDTKCNKCKLVS